MVGSSRGGGCNPCIAFLFGIVLIFGSIIGIWMNESSSVSVYEMLKEAEAAAIGVEGAHLTEGLGGKLVHVKGTLTTANIDKGKRADIVDNEFGIKFNGLKLKRTAEMYQWERRESKGSGDGPKQIFWERGWYEKAQPSFEGDRFHENPGSLPYQSKAWTAEKMRLGDFTLQGNIMNEVNWYEPISMKAVTSAKDGKASGLKVGKNEVALNFLSVDTSKLPQRYKMIGDKITTFAGGQKPEIGDMRIQYRAIREGPVSALAMTTGDGKLKKWMPKKINMYTAGGVSIVEKGNHSIEELIEEAVTRNENFTWIMRFLAIFVDILGWYLLLSPIEMLVSWIPLLGGLASALVGCGICFIALGLGLSTSVSTMSIAWLFNRPLIAVPALCLCGTILFTNLYRPIVIANRKARANEYKYSVSKLATNFVF